MFPVCALQQLEGGRALRSIRFSTYRYGVRRQGTVHIERDDDLQCTKGYTPPPPGPQKGEGETASRSCVVCVCAGHHHGMMCRGSLGRGHLRRRRVDGRFSHESRPAGFCRSRVGLGLFFVDCPFFFSRPAVGGMNRWRRGERERGDLSSTIVALSLLLVVRFKVRPLASALQWRGSREGPGGGYVPYPMLPFSIFPFSLPLRLPFMPCLANSRRRHTLCVVWWSGFPSGWTMIIPCVFPRMMESFDAVAFFLFWAILNHESSVPAPVSTPPIPRRNQLASSRWYGDAQQLPSWHRRSVRGTKQ